MSLHDPTLLHRSSLTFTPGQVFSTSPQPAVSISAAALEFEELSSWTFLLKHYNATDLFECFPFLVIDCKGPPSEEQRPFTIAGAIAIWKDAEDLNFKPLIGDLSQADDIGIDPAMANKILPLEVPSQEVILYPANDVFPECKAISVLWEMSVIELPATSKEEHLIRPQNLPCDIENCPLILRFHNGPLPNSERRRRAVQPMPRLLESAVCDETDYVKQDGRFYPGTMISSVTKTGDIMLSSSALSAVRNGAPAPSAPSRASLNSARSWPRRLRRRFEKEFPVLEVEHQLIDSAAMIMVKNPTGLKGVVVTSNLFGDVISDEASVIPGSIGLLSSASLSGIPDDKGKCNGIYEPIHGSAPDISGKGIVNPIGTILSVAMLLRYSLNLPEEVVRAALNGSLRTKDLGGDANTKEVGEAVVKDLTRIAKA